MVLTNRCGTVGRTSIALAAASAAMTVCCIAHAVSIPNPSFQDAVADVPVGWSFYGAGFRAEAGAGCNGNGGLVWESAEPLKSQAGATCEIAGWSPDEEYEFSVQVRTEGFTSPSYKGVNLCIEWYDERGGYLGGSYSRGGRGSSEWKAVTGVTKPIPDEARKAVLKIYIGIGSTGKAFFDDVVIRPRKRPPVHYLCSDVYRDVAADGNVRFAASIHVSRQWSGGASAVFRYRDANGTQCAVPAQTLTDREALLRVHVADLAMGRQTISCELTVGGVSLGSASLQFTRVSTLPKRRVWIDRHNRCMVDGKPFFPLGLYLGDVTAETLSVYTNGPFNCVMPYGVMREKQLDLCHAAGIMSFVSFQNVCEGSKNGRKYRIDTPAKVDAFYTNRIARLKNHPAVLGWYVFDEPPQLEIPARRRIYQCICAEDDQHPAWGVYHRIDHLREYLPICDILGIDPYPIPTKPAGSITELLRLSQNALFGNRAMWNVTQTFNWKRKDVPDDRFPTEDELRSMYWQYVVGGANGLIGYSFASMRRNESADEFSRQWTSLCKVVREIRDLTSVILSIEPVPSLKTSSDEVVCRAWSKDGRLHVAVCNIAAGIREATITLGSGSWRQHGFAAGGRAEMTTPQTLTVTLPENGVALVRLDSVTAIGEN